MQTHYFRKKLRGKKFVTTSQSVFYNLLPEDELVTKQRLLSSILQQKDAPFKTAKAAEDMLTSMVKDGFIEEVYGMKLDRFLGL